MLLYIDPVVSSLNPPSASLSVQVRREGQMKRSVYGVKLALSVKILAYRSYGQWFKSTLSLSFSINLRIALSGKILTH